MYGLTPTTTLVIMPPQDSSAWDTIVAIKTNHMNPRIPRPPYPHITLMQPFVREEHLDEVTKLLAEGLKDFPSFRITLADFNIFDNGKCQTLYLDPVCDPPGALEALYARLVELLPSYALKQDFVPHIGIGFFKNRAKAEQLKETYQADWTPISFQVTQLDINARDPSNPRVPFTSQRHILFT